MRCCKLLFVILLILLVKISIAQQRIDSSFSFQTDPAKQYSLYIPSNYIPGTANKAMVAFHAFNTSRWNSVSWCDTLIAFAEENNILLICPDGGTDGQVNDPIDTAFTSALLDSVKKWYTVGNEKIYAMGFSVGGLTTYTYGLSHAGLFGGFLPIGAAINGTSEVTTALQQNVVGKPVYIIHGTSDSPNTRFYPVKDSLISKGAFVNYKLMSGVGHTIDFPNRNAILKVGFQWIDSVNCAIIDSINSIPTSLNSPDNLTGEGFISVTTIRKGELSVEFYSNEIEKVLFSIHSLNGMLLHSEMRDLNTGANRFSISFKNLEGIYILNTIGSGKKYSGKILIL